MLSQLALYVPSLKLHFVVEFKYEFTRGIEGQKEPMMLLLRENVRLVLSDNVRQPLQGWVVNNQPRLLASAAAFACTSTVFPCVNGTGERLRCGAKT